MGNLPVPAPKAAAFFDLDKTIIATSSTLAFSRPLTQAGLISRASALKSAYAQLLFTLSGADAKQVERMRAAITEMVAGWDVEQVRAIVDETLHELIDPRIYEEAAALIAEHQAAGRLVVVVSSSGEDVVGPIADMLGADVTVATRMVVDDGKYTGEIAFYAYGEGKAQAIHTLAQMRGLRLDECYAYSDSITDLPMLEAVGHPHAVNADRQLRKVATERQWPILDFARPVPLRPQISASKPLIAGAAVGVGVGAAAIGLAVRAANRRRPTG
jgi:HAD superfamily hydrolase (TIGR01490 family)